MSVRHVVNCYTSFNLDLFTCSKCVCVCDELSVCYQHVSVVLKITVF